MLPGPRPHRPRRPQPPRSSPQLLPSPVSALGAAGTPGPEVGGDRPGGPRRGQASLASRCQATSRWPRRGPAAVLPSPAVGSALPLAAAALRSPPIERPPPPLRPHWRAALWPRRVTFSHHSPLPPRPLRPGRWAGPVWRRLRLAGGAAAQGAGRSPGGGAV